jgi:hypothetical protein
MWSTWDRKIITNLIQLNIRKSRTSSLLALTIIIIIIIIIMLVMRLDEYRTQPASVGYITTAFLLQPCT